MTEAEYRARIDGMIGAEYEALGGDALRSWFGDVLTDKIVKSGLGRRMQAELERDDQFRLAYCYDQAARDFARYLEDRRPQGSYRSDGILQLALDKCVHMPRATREHLLAWALWESDERNLNYAKTRLDHWGAHPECHTLAELEAALAED
jgi:hypothetical protein